MTDKNEEIGGGRGGYYGEFGGRFIPETLMAALGELSREFDAAMADEQFTGELDRCMREIAGRPGGRAARTGARRRAG